MNYTLANTPLVKKWLTMLASLAKSAGGAGIVIQFPFYAGIMAIMLDSGLAASLSEWFVSFSTAAAQALGADMPRVAMAVACGDSWTNMLQPFWALPVLAIAGLKAKDIMGYCLIQLFVSGILISTGLTWL